jgi:phage terminase large subunit-like protein
VSGPTFTDWTPGYGPGGGQWRGWDSERKDALRRRLEDEIERRRTMWACNKRGCDGSPHGEFISRHARWNQLPPADLPRMVRDPKQPVPVEVNLPWLEWLIMAGRGWGKTRTGAEFVKWRIFNGGRGHRVALIGRTAADVRDTMIEGESGLLSVFKLSERPEYQPSKRRVVFHNGAMAYCYSSDEPDQLRGPQHHSGWVDELATFGNLDKVISNYRLGMRLGRSPRVAVTTTPRPRKEIREMRHSPTTVVTGGTTYENLANLAPVFHDQVVRKYEGTRLGRQELQGEYLEDVEGALWTLDLIDQHRADLDRVKPFIRRMEIVVAIDPAVSYGGDETGIVIVGKLEDEGFVLADKSGHFSPHDWARTAIMAATSWGAGYIVAEKNQGGEMVQATLQSAGLPRGVRYRPVTASKGKRLRAEPISTLYERGLIHHVGVFASLEDQMTTWTPDDKVSPDRLDALVWACSHLFYRRRGMADVA